MNAAPQPAVFLTVERRVPPPPLWLLALITLSATLAMHIFVPALPLMARDLGVSGSAAQLTLSAYIIGLAAAQIAYGPISDHFGRRPALLSGMSIYAAASLAAWFAPTIDFLAVARFFQALGAGSGLVLGRAIVRDGASGAEAARRLSLMNLMTMAGPGLSPLIGAGLAAASGWRSIFAALCVLGFANLVLIWRRLPETAEIAGRDARSIFRNYGRLTRSRRFLGYAIGGGFATTCMYAYIGAAPFIFVDELHRPAREVAFYLALNIGGVWFGSLTASRVAGRFPMRRTLLAANLVSCASAFVFLGFTLAGALNVPETILSMLLLSYGAGVSSPMALTEALNINPAVAGSASGLYGFAQMLIGAACAGLSGVGRDPALATALVLTGAEIIAQIAFWVARPRLPPAAR